LSEFIFHKHDRHGEVNLYFSWNHLQFGHLI